MNQKWQPFAGLVTLFLAAAVAAAQTSAPLITVTTSAGLLQGLGEGGLLVFRGIPYARPPVGSLRWKAPEEPAHWSGVRNATAFGPACIQPVSPTPTMRR